MLSSKYNYSIPSLIVVNCNFCTGAPVYNKVKLSSHSRAPLTRTQTSANCAPSAGIKPITVELPTTRATRSEHEEYIHVADISDATKNDSTGSNQSVLDGRNTAMLISSSAEDSQIPSQTQHPTHSNISRCGSSLELFSSGSTTTANDSVILVSHESATSKEKTSMHEKPSSLTEQSDRPKENTLSAFLFNRMRIKQDSANCSPCTSSNLSTSLFSSHNSSGSKHSAASNASPLKPPSVDSNCEELTGSSSDECEDFLSNKAYRLRKRRHSKLVTASDDRACNSKPSRKRRRCINQQLKKQRNKTSRSRKRLNKVVKSQRYVFGMKFVVLNMLSQRIEVELQYSFKEKDVNKSEMTGLCSCKNSLMIN